MRFGQVLARFRKLRGLTQRELGERCAATRDRVSDLEKGRRKPTPEEVALLCRALPEAEERLKATVRLSRGKARKPLAGDLELVGRIPSPRPYLPKAEKSTDIWLAYARKTVPGLYKKLFDRIRRRSDYSQVQDHLALTKCDSKIELFHWAHGLADGALLFRQSLARLGLTHLPAVDPDTLEVVSGRPMAGYFWQRGVLATATTPQVTLLAERPYTVDGLSLAFEEDRRMPFIVEVDGDGHESQWNAQREKALKLPTLRFTQAQVLSPDYLDVYWKAVREMLDEAAPRCTESGSRGGSSAAGRGGASGAL